jgi:hypothetical protein
MYFLKLQNARFCLALVWVLFATPITAEVLVQAAPLPGLESDPPGTVVPQVCSVNVAAGRITVEMSVTTDAEMPALLLNGPFFGGAGEADPYPDRHFPELEIRIDGAGATPNDRFEAFAGKTNVTNLIRAAQMDPWAVARTPPQTSAHPQNPQVLNVLRNAGAIEPVDDGYVAKWQVRRVLRIPLHAVPEQRVELRYSARPARSRWNLEQLLIPARESEYCVSPNQLRGMLRGGRGMQGLEVTEYSIATTIDDHSPSTVTITLSEDTHYPRAAFFLCGPHRKSIAKAGAVTRQPALPDEHGTLRVLTVVESPAKSP